MKLIAMNIKTFVWIVLGLSVVFSSCLRKRNDQPEKDKAIMKLKGNVKTMLVINYSVSGKYTTFFAFNKGGSITEQTSFNNDGSLIRKWKFNYDSLDRKQKRYCYVRMDSLSYIQNYYYNASGML